MERQKGRMERPQVLLHRSLKYLNIGHQIFLVRPKYLHSSLKQPVIGGKTFQFKFPSLPCPSLSLSAKEALSLFSAEYFGGVNKLRFSSPADNCKMAALLSSIAHGQPATNDKSHCCNSRKKDNIMQHTTQVTCWHFKHLPVI